MERYELQQLRDLPIEGVAERLGISVTRHKALCPFHDDHHASLSFSQRRNTYRCFACGAHGGTIDLVMRRLGVGFREACSWLTDSPPGPSLVARGVVTPVSHGDNVSAPLPTRATGVFREATQCGFGPTKGSESPLATEGRLGVSLYERFFLRPFLNEEARRFLFEERRLDERVVRWCRLTSWRDRKGVPWLQIPYFDREGRLVGVQNRNLLPGALPRFRFPQGSECGIYNLPVLNRLHEGDELYITEGASDCWAMLSSGHKAIAIPSATLLTRKDKDILSALSSGMGLSFHMYPDRDLPGERLFLQLQELLPNLQHHQLPKGCKDFSELYKSLKV